MVVLYQGINLLIIIGAGIYLGREKVVHFFHQKREAFLKAQEKAQSLLLSAEHEHHEIKTRLDKLKINREEAIFKAKADAHDLKTQMLKDAQAHAAKLKADAEMTARLEFERAKHELKEQLIREAFDLSKKDLGAKATSDDQKRLQDDFITKVQVVQ
jgi:F-type H+-transporting ATPase subunit b